MFNSKRLLERISLARTKSLPKSDGSSTTSVADKGHFIVYSVEGRRFMVPLKFLSTSIFVELLRMSEEVFGLPGDSPITLPCDAAFLENVICMLKRRDRKELERSHRTLLSSSNSLLSLHHNLQLAVVGF